MYRGGGQKEECTGSGAKIGCISACVIDDARWSGNGGGCCSGGGHGCGLLVIGVDWFHQLDMFFFPKALSAMNRHRATHVPRPLNKRCKYSNACLTFSICVVAFASTLISQIIVAYPFSPTPCLRITAQRTQTRFLSIIEGTCEHE